MSDKNCFQRNAPANLAHKRQQTGFTLLEILVVLVILGLVVTISAPPLGRSLESTAFHARANDIESQINDLRIAALISRKNIRLIAISENPENEQETFEQRGQNAQAFSGDPLNFSPQNRTYQYIPVTPDNRQLTLPNGWSVNGQDIIFLSTGVCLGGTLEVRAPSGQKRDYNFKAPDCTII